MSSNNFILQGIQKRLRDLDKQRVQKKEAFFLEGVQRKLGTSIEPKKVEEKKVKEKNDLKNIFTSSERWKEPLLSDNPFVTGALYNYIPGMKALPVDNTGKTLEEIQASNPAAYNTGAVLGSLAKYGSAYGMLGPTVAKASMPLAQKMGSKLGAYMAIEGAKDLAIGTPIAAIDAAANVKRTNGTAKDFAKEMGANALMDVGANLLFFSGGNILKSLKNKSLLKKASQVTVEPGKVRPDISEAKANMSNDFIRLTGEDGKGVVHEAKYKARGLDQAKKLKVEAEEWAKKTYNKTLDTLSPAEEIMLEDKFGMKLTDILDNPAKIEKQFKINALDDYRTSQAQTRDMKDILLKAAKKQAEKEGRSAKRVFQTLAIEKDVENVKDITPDASSKIVFNDSRDKNLEDTNVVRNVKHKVEDVLKGTETEPKAKDTELITQNTGVGKAEKPEPTRHPDAIKYDDVPSKDIDQATRNHLNKVDTQNYRYADDLLPSDYTIETDDEFKELVNNALDENKSIFEYLQNKGYERLIVQGKASDNVNAWHSLGGGNIYNLNKQHITTTHPLIPEIDKDAIADMHLMADYFGVSINEWKNQTKASIEALGGISPKGYNTHGNTIKEGALANELDKGAKPLRELERAAGIRTKFHEKGILQEPIAKSRHLIPVPLNQFRGNLGHGLSSVEEYVKYFGSLPKKTANYVRDTLKAHIERIYSDINKLYHLPISEKSGISFTELDRMTTNLLDRVREISRQADILRKYSKPLAKDLDDLVETLNRNITRLNMTKQLANPATGVKSSDIVWKSVEKANIDAETRTILEFAQQRLGIKHIDMFEVKGKVNEARMVGGLHATAGNQAVIAIRENLPKTNNPNTNHAFILGHEFFHSMKVTDKNLFDEMLSLLDYSSDIISKSPRIRALIKNVDPSAYKKAQNAGKLEKLFKDRALDFKEEFMADEFAKHFMDGTLWEKLLREDASMFTKIKYHADKFMQALKNFTSAKKVGVSQSYRMSSLRDHVYNAIARARARVVFDECLTPAQKDTLKNTTEWLPIEVKAFSEISDNKEAMIQLKELGKLSNYDVAMEDVERIFPKVFGGKDSENFKIAKALYLDPFFKAKDLRVKDLKRWMRAAHRIKIKGKALKTKSAESKILFRYGTGKMSFEELWKKHPDIAKDIIDADKTIRELYTEVIDEVNLMNDYFFPDDQARQIVLKPGESPYHYFQNLGDEFGKGLENLFDTPANVSSRHAKPTGMNVKAIFHRGKDLPHSEDAMAGLLEFLGKCSYVKNIDPQTARFRQLAKNIKKTIKESNSTSKDTVAANNFGNFLDEFATVLSGKRNKYDAMLIEMLGGGPTANKIFKTADYLVRRAKASIILGKAKSSISQFMNLPQAMAQIKNPVHLSQGFKDTVEYLFKTGEGETIFKKSPFLEERYIEDIYSQFKGGILSKPKRLATYMLEFGDSVGTRMTWSARYHQLIAQGLPEKQAIEQADIFTRKMVAGRGVGEVPIAQQSLLFQIVAPFQLEVANVAHLQKEMWGDLFKGKKGSAGTVAAFYMLCYLFDEASEAITGSGAIFNPIGAGLDVYADPELRNFPSFIGRMGGEVLSNYPGGNFVAGFMDDAAKTKYFGEKDPSRFGTPTVFHSMAKHPVYSLAFPFGGDQIRKSLEAARDLQYIPDLNMFKGTLRPNDHFMKMNPSPGKFNYDKGKYTMRYPISQKETDSLVQSLKVLAFGSHATEAGRDYYKKGRIPLTEKQTLAVVNSNNPALTYTQIMKQREVRSIENKIKTAYEDFSRGGITQAQLIKTLNTQEKCLVKLVKESMRKDQWWKEVLK